MRFGRFSGANLADVVQEIFLKAFSRSARSSYQRDRDYGPFLTAIARNVIYDWLKRTAREFFDVAAIDAALGSTASSDDPEAVFSAELIAVVSRYVEGLPQELQRVHQRRFVMAEPQRTAAGQLGISRQTLRTMEKKIVDGLRQELARVEAAADLPASQPHQSAQKGSNNRLRNVGQP